MKIKITNCSDPFFWYARKIGEIKNVERESADCYWTREDAGYSNFVLKVDCEVVTYKIEEKEDYMDNDALIADIFTRYQDKIHADNVKAGWWTDLESGTDLAEEARKGTRLGKALVAEKLCLIHSEISEAMEGARKGLQDDKLPHRKMIEVELADAFIRGFDLAGALGLDIGAAMQEKRDFNRTREDHKIENRTQVGGKAY